MNFMIYMNFLKYAMMYKEIMTQMIFHSMIMHVSILVSWF